MVKRKREEAERGAYIFPRFHAFHALQPLPYLSSLPLLPGEEEADLTQGFVECEGVFFRPEGHQAFFRVREN